MTYLLDVSMLIAWLWSDHEFHRRVRLGNRRQGGLVMALNFPGSPVKRLPVKPARAVMRNWPPGFQSAEIGS